MDRITQEAHARQRYLKYFLKHKNATETAIRYKISRKTLYKWLKRYDGTWQSLMEQSRRPHSSPRAHTAEEIRQIRRLAKKHNWEDLILAYQEMREKYGYMRSYGGFKRIVSKLKAAKGNKKRKGRKNKPYQRAEYPGQKVQVDVKFVPEMCIVDGRKYYQFTAVDECTRWTYRQMYDEHSTYSAEAFLIELIERCPFPIREIQTDNGTEFTKALISNDPNDKSLFESKLEEYQIKYHRIRIATPRHNGKVERQHRIDQQRFYNRLRMYSLEDGRKQLAVYQNKSNDYIKHCLGLRSPNQVLADYLAVM
jgi:transposase